MHLYVSMFFYVADDKEENARKRTKFANHSSSQSNGISGILFIYIYL